MKERLIKAEALKNYCRSRRNRNTSDLRSQTLKTFALQLVEDFCKDVDRQKPVEAIPVDWIRTQLEEYPGMESAMWGKLLRLWEKEKTQRELYGGEE